MRPRVHVASLSLSPPLPPPPFRLAVIFFVLSARTRRETRTMAGRSRRYVLFRVRAITGHGGEEEEDRRGRGRGASMRRTRDEFRATRARHRLKYLCRKHRNLVNGLASYAFHLRAFADIVSGHRRGLGEWKAPTRENEAEKHVKRRGIFAGEESEINPAPGFQFRSKSSQARTQKSRSTKMREKDAPENYKRRAGSRLKGIGEKKKKLIRHTMNRSFFSYPSQVAASA